MSRFRHNLLLSVVTSILFTLFPHDIASAEKRRQIQLHREPNRECTWYAAPSGKINDSGEDPESPVSLRQAARSAQPGDVVCLLPGTYNLKTPLYISTGGTAEAYVTYTSYDPGHKALIRWTGSSGDDMFQVNSKAGYITLQGLAFDGKNIGTAAIKCSRGSHHIRVIGNTIKNAGQGGVSAVGCDYLTIDGNRIHHTGYGAGWGSGVSLNKSIWYDQAPGFHSFVVNNIISGSYDNSDHHSDGNGIIMDLGGNTPPVLIANNLIYQNGGRCIHIHYNQNKWIVNNTCYQNLLDSKLNDDSGIGKGEYSMVGSSDVYLINNIAYTAARGYAFKQADSRDIMYYSNAYHSEYGLVAIPKGVSGDQLQLQQANPQFVRPIMPDPQDAEQFRRALPPGQVQNRFHLLPNSPLIDAGIDPRSVPGLTPALKAGIARYVLNDIDGIARPQGKGFDLGAYETIGRAKLGRQAHCCANTPR